MASNGGFSASFFGLLPLSFAIEKIIECFEVKCSTGFKRFTRI